MSDTPETDKAKRSWEFFYGQEVVNVYTARKLERERDYLKAMVTAANTQLDVALRERDEARREAEIERDRTCHPDHGGHIFPWENSVNHPTP